MKELEILVQRMAELERKISGMIRQGVVTDVDPAKQLFRMEVGRDSDGKPVKGPWIPYAQQAGALKIHTPPSVGQQMMAVSPSGDPQQAVGVPYTWSNQNVSPSQSGSENVVTFGSVTIKLVAGGIEITGGTIKHDGKNIGSNHTHDGVEPGTAQTGAPT